MRYAPLVHKKIDRVRHKVAGFICFTSSSDSQETGLKFRLLLHLPFVILSFSKYSAWSRRIRSVRIANWPRNFHFWPYKNFKQTPSKTKRLISGIFKSLPENCSSHWLTELLWTSRTYDIQIMEILMAQQVIRKVGNLVSSSMDGKILNYRRWGKLTLLWWNLALIPAYAYTVMISLDPRRNLLPHWLMSNKHLIDLVISTFDSELKVMLIVYLIFR